MKLTCKEFSSWIWLQISLPEQLVLIIRKSLRNEVTEIGEHMSDIHGTDWRSYEPFIPSFTAPFLFKYWPPLQPPPVWIAMVRTAYEISKKHRWEHSKETCTAIHTTFIPSKLSFKQEEPVLFTDRDGTWEGGSSHPSCPPCFPVGPGNPLWAGNRHREEASAPCDCWGALEAWVSWGQPRSYCSKPPARIEHTPWNEWNWWLGATEHSPPDALHPPSQRACSEYACAQSLAPWTSYHSGDTATCLWTALECWPEWSSPPLCSNVKELKEIQLSRNWSMRHVAKQQKSLDTKDIFQGLSFPSAPSQHRPNDLSGWRRVGSLFQSWWCSHSLRREQKRI